MSQRVISSISYTRGSFTDCIDSLSMEYTTVPDEVEISTLTRKIKDMEEKISKLEMQDELMKEYIKQTLNHQEEIIHSRCQEIAECIFKSDQRILNFSNNQ